LLLKFTKGNAKLDTSIHIFSLPAGWSCGGALKCLSKADPETGKIKDGKNTEFRCYAASQEALYKNVRDHRWYNFGLLRAMKSKDKMRELILKSLPKSAKIVRLHSSGDFFNEPYFLAWLETAKSRPDIHFYSYTKSLPFWIKHLDKIPKNMVLNASEGGKYDSLIEKFGLKYAKVVFSREEALKKRLQIDHDDSKAMKGNKSFALLLHGVQPGGTPAAKALSALRSTGFTGYSKKPKTVNLPLIGD